MKKIYLFLILFTLCTSGIFALEVNKDELQKAGSDTTIEFINYTGPHKVIDSLSAIKGIGSSMGDVVGKSFDKPVTAGNVSKYYVIHAIDSSTKDKLDADIILIGKEATVDHIVNLRRIISAYLSAAYGYSEKDADTLAVFITVYNAVYRGQLDTFKSKYKDVVLKNLSEKNCGLSVNYEDWPGQSEIVIPLFDIQNGGLSTVDTSLISDDKVVSSMKEDDDKNIESRKEMVDLKEREADESSEKAKASQKQATEESKKLSEEKQKTEEVKKEADKATKEAEKAKKTAEENPEDEQAKQAAEKAQKEAEKKQTQVKEQEAKVAEQEKKTEEAKQEAAEQQALSDKKTTEAQEERKEIAKDQKEVMDKEAENALAPSDYGIVLSDENKLLSRLVKFNSSNGEIIKNSPVSVIRNRTIFKAGQNYIAIAGEDKGNGAIKLVLIDPQTLEICAESDNTIAPDSVLIQDGNEYFCVINDNGKYYVGKFDESLALKLKSNIEVKSCTPITVTDSGIVVTDSKGKLVILNKKDLGNIN